MKPGTLYLIPVPLGSIAAQHSLPTGVCTQTAMLKHFIAESAKSARAFLKTLPLQTPLQEIAIAELNEHTTAATMPPLLNPLIAGHDVGLISEAGCPAVADPGAHIVALAHDLGIRVTPMIGPSSILLALMGSGLSGQNFAFHGYLPTKEDQRHKKVIALEKDSRVEKRTQIFIETPYRNSRMMQGLLNSCAPRTRVCVATDLTLESEFILTRTVAEWKKVGPPEIDRRPTVFLLQAD